LRRQARIERTRGGLQPGRVGARAASGELIEPDRERAARDGGGGERAGATRVTAQQPQAVARPRLDRHLAVRADAGRPPVEGFPADRIERDAMRRGGPRTPCGVDRDRGAIAPHRRDGGAGQPRAVDGHQALRVHALDAIPIKE
jgi:hypothetical protein